MGERDESGGVKVVGDADNGSGEEQTDRETKSVAAGIEEGSHVPIVTGTEAVTDHQVPGVIPRGRSRAEWRGSDVDLRGGWPEHGQTGALTGQGFDSSFHLMKMEQPPRQPQCQAEVEVGGIRVERWWHRGGQFGDEVVGEAETIVEQANHEVGVVPSEGAGNTEMPIRLQEAKQSANEQTQEVGQSLRISVDRGGFGELDQRPVGEAFT